MTQTQLLAQKFSFLNKWKSERVSREQVLSEKARARLPASVSDVSHLRAASKDTSADLGAKMKNHVFNKFMSDEWTVTGEGLSSGDDQMWVTSAQTAGSACSNDPAVVYSVPANVCLATNSTSFKITSSNSQIYQTQYNSTTCSADVLAVESMPLGCFKGAQYSYSNQPAYPTNNGLGYTVETFYDTGCDSLARSHLALSVGYCFQESSTSSSMYFNTSSIAFSNGNCNFTMATGNHLITDYPTTCHNFNSSNYYYGGFGAPSYLWSYQPATLPEAVDADGYLVLGYSLSDTCSTVPSQIAGYALNACQVDAMSSDSSFLYQCGDEYAYKYVFQSGNCDPATQTFIERYDLGCGQAASETDDDPVSVYAYCSKGSDVQAPGNAYYGIEMYYDAENCDGSALNYFGFANQVCVPFQGVSYMLDYPALYEYPLSTDCSGSSVEIFEMASAECGSMFVGADRATLELETMPTYYGTDGMGYFVQGELLQGSAVVSSSSSSNSLSTASQAGLALGLFILVAIILGGIVAFIVKRNQKKSLASEAQDSNPIALEK